MAPRLRSLRSTAPPYTPQMDAQWIPPPPVLYACPLPPPDSLPWPALGPAPPPPPPPPCWQPQLPCAPGPFHGCVVPVPVPHGAVPMAVVPSRPAPPSARPRCHRKGSTATRRPVGPAAAAASCGMKAATGDSAKEAAAANQPSPRSVLAVVPSPPISPTTSLPASFPCQLMLPAPPAVAAVTSAAAPSPAEVGSVALRPPMRRGRRLRGPRRARPTFRVLVRHAVKPRRLFDPTSERTSLMIRNIPNDFTMRRLMNILDQHCFIENEKIAPDGVRSGYDFLYVPVDFRTLSNKGYAFVNMTSPEAARRLWVHLHKCRWAFKGTAKTCAVDYAVLQGRDELVTHFSESRFDCHNKEFLPVWFEPPRDGNRPAAGAMHVVGRLGRPHAGHGK